MTSEHSGSLFDHFDRPSSMTAWMLNEQNTEAQLQNMRMKALADTAPIQAELDELEHQRRRLQEALREHRADLDIIEGAIRLSRDKGLE